MKATGIVRRIDDLGRVVIPKEIRRTLRIREGDPLEIYTERDGEVIFKKYSPMGDLQDFADQICDSIGKKVKVAGAVAEGLGLENVTCVQARAESLPGRFDYVVSRAVTDLATFYPWVKDKFQHAIFYLKGGDIEAEIADCARRCRLDPAKFFQVQISNWFGEEWFEGKKHSVFVEM